MQPELIVPDWPAPPHVQARITTRQGGVSHAPYASLNLGDHVGDDPAQVAENRRRLRASLPAEPVWLRQVHGTRCVDAARLVDNEADAAFSTQADVVCAVLTADCLPVLLCDRAGSVVAAAHAGWRGLLAGIIEATVAAMRVPGAQVIAWLGPAIGPQQFEVGDEVRAAFLARDAHAAAAFRPHPPNQGKWLCDLTQLARQRLATLDITDVYGGTHCTVTESARYFSYRRDGVTGRMASLIWLEAQENRPQRQSAPDIDSAHVAMQN